MMKYGLQWAVAHARQHPSLDMCSDCPVARRELAARDAAEARSLKNKAMDEQESFIEKLPPGIDPRGPNRL